MLGTPGNITEFRWRVDGGAVEEIDFISHENNRLLSPEFLQVRLKPDGNGSSLYAELGGAMDASGDSDELARTVQAFLEQLIGDQDENEALAQRFIAYQSERGAIRQVPIGYDGSRHEPQAPPEPPEFRLPAVPWSAASLMAWHASNETIRDGNGRLEFVRGPWSWTVSVDQVSNSTEMPGARWWIWVDARDQAMVNVASLAPSNATEFQDATRLQFAILGLPAPETEDWHWSPMRQEAFVC